jgi:hypothetical protein
MTDRVLIERIERRQTKRGMIMYLPIRVLRARKHYIQALAWLIPHATRPPELALRIERFDTTNHDEPKHEIVMTESEIQELLEYVEAASDVRDQTPGSYALIRLAAGLEGNDAIVDPDALANLFRNPALSSALRAPEIADLLASSIGDIVRLGALRNAIDQLEALLANNVGAEHVYQDWLEAHTWALGNLYVRRDSVRRVSASDDVDILLESAGNGLRDVYELKRADMPVLQYDREHKTSYWAHPVTKAIGQCHRYLDVLHDKLRNGLEDHPEIVAYHPRAFIIIGRSNTWSRRELYALHGLNARLHGITVMTYDQLLAQCRALLTHVNQPD